MDSPSDGEVGRACEALDGSVDHMKEVFKFIMSKMTDEVKKECEQVVEPFMQNAKYAEDVLKRRRDYVENHMAKRQVRQPEVAASSSQYCFRSQSQCPSNAQIVENHMAKRQVRQPEVAASSSQYCFKSQSQCPPNAQIAGDGQSVPVKKCGGDAFFKTTLCKYHSTGRCRHGASCSFAHGEGDLRR